MKKKVAYFYNAETGRYHYGKDHPMKPKRIAMAHSLITNMGIYRDLNVIISYKKIYKKL
jgi:histone deacetylase 1/2